MFPKFLFSNSILLIVMTLLSLSMVTGLDQTMPCDQQSDFETLVCGATPNSYQGYGAVDICSKCYPCGVSDGVCPEDFYSNGMQTDCHNCPDPDCTGNVTVNVKTDGGSTVSADVYALYSDGQENVGTTTDGSLENAVVRSGNIEFRADYSDYDSEIVSTYVPRGGHNETNIMISKGSCNKDCTGSFNNVCKASCDGVAGCTYNSSKYFTRSKIKASCEGKQIGEKVKVGSNETHIQYAVCCDGSEVISEKRNELDLSRNLDTGNSRIRHMAHHVIPVEYDGEIVELVITSFQKD